MKVEEQVSFLKHLSRNQSYEGNKELASNIWECAITLESIDAKNKALTKTIKEMVKTDG